MSRPAITMLPSIGLPDPKQAARLMAPVILSLWEHHGQRSPVSEKFEGPPRRQPRCPEARVDGAGEGPQPHDC